ncbi:MAG: hypothetical protein E5Y85_35115, partial [Mesorhizobium sp.]
MTTPPGAGSGSATVWIVGTSPNFSKTTAFIGNSSLGCVDIQVMPACERRFPALPVLTYPKVRSAPV